MFSAVSSMLSEAKGISQIDLPENCAMIATPKEMSEKETGTFEMGVHGYVVAFLNASTLKCKLRGQKWSVSYPIDMLAALSFELVVDGKIECVSVRVLVPEIRESKSQGRELVTEVLKWKTKILSSVKALSLNSVVERKVTSIAVEATQPPIVVSEDVRDIPTVEEMIARAGPVYMWDLYTCVLVSMANPVSGFALPNKARRVAITYTCFGMTGCNFSDFVSLELYKRVAEVLHFPKIVQRELPILCRDSKTGNEEALFWNDLYPVVTALASEIPGKVFVSKADVGKVVKEIVLMDAEFDTKVSLFGWKCKPHLKGLSAEDRVCVWCDPKEMDEISLW